MAGRSGGPGRPCTSKPQIPSTPVVHHASVPPAALVLQSRCGFDYVMEGGRFEVDNTSGTRDYDILLGRLCYGRGPVRG